MTRPSKYKQSLAETILTRFADGEKIGKIIKKKAKGRSKQKYTYQKKD